MTDSEKQFWAMVSEACQGAFEAIRESNLRGEGPYLYYKKGALKLAIDKPGPKWELASPERMRVATFDQVGIWIAERSRNLPLF